MMNRPDQRGSAIGNDAPTAAGLEKMGAVHENCPVGGGVGVDNERRIVTTPAYMLAQRVSEVAEGADKLVTAVLDLVAKGAVAI